MKLYYFINSNGQQAGPISVENFKNNGITINTNVWCEGMSQWTKAGDVPELKEMFTQAPTQIPPTINSQTKPTGECPNNYLIFSVLTTLICCLPSGIIAIIYSNKANTAWASGNRNEAQKNSEQAKMWCLISVGCGIIFFILSFIMGFIGAL